MQLPREEDAESLPRFGIMTATFVPSTIALEMTDFFGYFIVGLSCFVAGMLLVVAMDKVAVEDLKNE